MEKSGRNAFEIIYSEDGRPVNIKINGKTIYSINIARQSELWYEQNVRDFSEDFIIVFGFGLGLHLERLLREKSEERMVYLVIEDKDSFMKTYQQSGLDLRLFEGIFSLDEIQGLYDIVANSLGVIAKKGIRIIDFPAITRAMEGDYKKFLQDLNDVLGVAKINFNTMGILGPQMEINQAVNIIRTLKYPGIKNLKGILEDYPVVIVGAGPSLSKNINILKENKEKLFIIAVGRVVKLLKEKDIDPDMICIIDPNELQYDYLSGVDLKDTYITADHKSSYKVFQYIDAKYWAFDRNDSMTKWLRSFTDHKGYMGDFFNVAQFASQLAFYLTMGPIAMIGVDLAFSNRTHAEGVILSQQVDPASSPHTMWVPGNVEEKVPTMPNMYSMIKFFELTIRRNRKIYNATEGGARIEGAEITTLENFARMFSRDGKERFKDSIEGQYLLEKYGEKELQGIKENINSILTVLFKIQKGYQKGRGYVEKLKKLSQHTEKNASKINDCLSRIDRLHEEMYGLANKAHGFVEARTVQSELLLRTRRDDTLKYKEMKDNKKVLESEINRFGKYFESMVFHVEYAAQILLNMLAVLDEEYLITGGGRSGDDSACIRQKS